ncbi:hypothetical protein BDF20DRAFT_69883 [Mycotypha africana]|uniref:uncharacterized protein n=1 Tax=Mycotypha africana TaxID=64632 RepID=UPI002301CFF1|nr:uncharacterized protein BDF20DRAFT_69883 [Mycotypha africana]KAI8991893.1 hypothetical protein BDF20DRAFT_69883 [Mycotypha africana]
MLDKALSEIVFDIALEGEKGCSFDRFFELIRKAIGSSLTNEKLLKPLQFDVGYKAFLWTKVKDNPHLIFMKNDTVIEAPKFSFEELSTDITVKAAEKIQDDILYGHLKSEKKNLTEIYRNILSIVAKSKKTGVTQLELAELLQINHKTTFRYLKRLCQLGLIIKEKVYRAKRATNILYHWQFVASVAETNSVRVDTESLYRIEKLKKDILDQLKKADDNMMSLRNLVHSLGITGGQPGKWVRATICKMHDQGQLVKFIAYDGISRVASVRLPRKSEYETIKRTSELCADDKTSVRPCQRNRYAILRDLPFEYVVYQDIVRSRGDGFSKVDFTKTYPYIDSNLFKFFCDNTFIISGDLANQKYPLYRTEEIGGKVKQYRYYSEEGWKESAFYSHSISSEPHVEDRSFSANPELDVSSDIDSVGFETKEYVNHSNSPMKRSRSYSETIKTNDNGNSSTKKYKVIDTRAASIEIDDAASNSSFKSPSEKVSEVTVPISTEQIHCNSSNNNKRKREDNDIQSQQSQSKAGRRIKTTVQNNTKARRYAIILEMLEEQNILELNHELYNKFVELEAAAANGQGIARKTFFALVKQLQEQNKLKYYVTVIETSFGVTEKKTFLLHPTLSENDAQVQQYIDKLKCITSSGPKRRELETVNVTEVPTKREAKGLKLRSPPSTEYGATNGLTDSFNGTVISGNNAIALDSSLRKKAWLFRATEYGYSTSKWHRARILHQTMLSYCISEQSVDRVIAMSDMLNQMPLKTFIQLYGVLPFENQTFLAFLNTRVNLDVALKDLPHNIKTIMSDAVRKFRYTLTRSLSLLKALELIDPVHDQELQGPNVPLRIALHRIGNIRDYTKKERPLIVKLPLESSEDVSAYWNQLQTHCTETIKDVDYIADKNDPLAGITLRRGWSSNTSITDEQKATLDSFVDFEAKTVPDVDNRVLRSHIMKLTNLSAKRVRIYYNAVLISFKKFEMKKIRTDRLKKPPRKSSSAIVNDLIRASIQKQKVALPHYDNQEMEMFQQPTFIGSRKVKKLRVVVEPHQSLNGNSRITGIRRTKDPFTSLEKDILIHSYCIMKTRAKMSLFYWSPISQVLPNHTPERCRHKLNAMLNKRPQLTTDIEELKTKWLKYYQEGLEKKEITDENSWDTVNYDLTTYLEYFLRKLKEEDSRKVAITVLLPSQAKKLRERYRIERSDSQNEQTKRLLISHSVNPFGEQDYDTKANLSTYNKTEVSKQLIATLIKMNLMTPDDRYAPKDAYKMLSVYPEDLIQQSLHELKSKELIISDKSRYGRIPGRRINVSERFMNLATSIFPERMTEKARNFYSAIVSERSCNLTTALLNSGFMAALLDLFSQGKLNIDLLNKEQFLQSKKVLCYPKPTAIPLRDAFVFRNFDLQVTIGEDIVDNIYSRSYTSISQVSKTTLTLQDIDKCTITTVTNLDPWAQPVYNVIHHFGARGASTFEIQSELNTNTDDILRALDFLLQSKPPAIHIVGFSSLRYVATVFAPKWLMHDSTNKRWIYPLMWHDTNGHLLESALEGTAEVIMSHILAKPGITFGNLRAKLHDILSDYELYHILKYLGESHRIVSKTIRRASRPHRSSIFDKRRITAVLSSKGINNNEITHYWLAPDYYLNKL